MKKKMIYRIELREIDTIFTDMVLMAAASNGGTYTPLNKIADAADWICKKYPATGEMHTVNRIGDNLLTIDKGTKNILALTEVEIFELDLPMVTSQEAKDILEEIRKESPLLSNTGINDEGNMEALN